MLVIVDGVDKTGKTTLCEELCRTFGGEVLHFGPPKSTDLIEEYILPIGQRYTKGNNLFIDRHYLGECIWPSFFGRPTSMTDSMQAMIERVLERIGCVPVLAVRDPHELNQACVDEPPGTDAWLVQIDFQSRAASSYLPWIEYEQGRAGDLDYIVEQAVAMDERGML